MAKKQKTNHRKIENIQRLPIRKRRSESFLGLHFDFHAKDTDPKIGQDLTEQMVYDIIDKIQPDYIQVDCKGHMGYSSYPTAVGNRAPNGYAKDPLRIWRKATAQRGVALYVHYSGVWDIKAVSLHPEWAAIQPDGKPNPNFTSVFGKYVDQLLIPQLIELYEKYQIDGVWLDGECWAVALDYNPDIVKRFCRQYSLDAVPKDPSEPNWPLWVEFNREGFRRYLCHYTKILHHQCPGLQIASNWAFTSLMPEPVSAEVDFLSGDFSLQDSLRESRWQVRCLRHQGKPWDLMAWGFGGHMENVSFCSIKSAKQLCQEAAIVLAAGGGFQCYFTQRRDGSVATHRLEAMAEVARFCRARQPYCHKSQSVPQAAVIYHTAAAYRKMTKPFNPHFPDQVVLPAVGVLEALLDNQYHVDVLMDHQLDALSRWPAVVFAEWESIEPKVKTLLTKYVQKGGNLLIAGPKSVALFNDILNLKKVKIEKDQICWLEYNGQTAGLKTAVMKTSLPKNVVSVGRLFAEDYLHSANWPAAGVWKMGKGAIVAVFASLGEPYYNKTTAVARDFIGELAKYLLPEPLVEVFGSHQVELTINQIEVNQKPVLAVHLINTAGHHRDRNVYTFDQIEPVGPLLLTIRSPRKPHKIVKQPGNQTIEFVYERGTAKILIERLEIYDIYLVE